MKSGQPSDGSQLPVMEQFLTIQGEGIHAGRVAYFIRLGGCDVGCVWCDVKESWPLDSHPLFSVSQLAENAKHSGAEIAVITGGEPALHNLEPLTGALHQAGLRTHIETSGSSALTGRFDWVTLSPKKFKLPLQQAYQLADELKVIVFNQHDLKWAQQQANYVRESCALLLQPEWSRRETAAQWIIEFAKAHPRWRVSVQTHKYLNVP